MILRAVTDTYALDDDLPADAANDLPDFTRDFDRVMISGGEDGAGEHDADGNHNTLRIPAGVAIASSAGAAVHSSGITVSKPGAYPAGRYLVQLDAAIQPYGSQDWHCLPVSLALEPTIGTEDEGTGAVAKDNTKTDIRFWRNTGAAVDVAFLVLVFVMKGFR